ncbi:hypothetical protein GCM10022243_59900 [Saccharothrix violaceirubra]|uniref:Putative membrane protein n=1 Tax=Saccharothrix violaceirubra TaxID=413306 RepID=A0A7W7T5E4_9PSEU|nr:hypothetical protein [Saccharothrix violaceirubra]MBB4966914.1 putative membrane protein [Saccharothrix violaceirubra]
MGKALRACLGVALITMLTTVPTGVAEAAADPPAIIDLGTLPGDDGSGVTTLNNADTVIGYSRWRRAPGDATSTYRPVKWNAAGVISALPIPPGDTNSSHVVVDLNDSGVIIGNSTDAVASGPTDRGLRWAPDGTVKVLAPLPGDTASRATDVTADGTVLGQSWRQGSPARVALWSPDGKATTLPVPSGYDRSSGGAINDDKVVVGNAEGPGKPRLTLLWKPDGTYVEIQDRVGYPFLINNAGAVAGWSPGFRCVKLNPDGTVVDLGPYGQLATLTAAGAVAGGIGNPPYWQPTRWTPDGTATTLPRLPGDQVGSVADIDDRNVTVGASTHVVSTIVREHHAVYWTPDGTLVPLGALPGGKESWTRAINSKGTIAGNSSSPRGERAVLWRL